MKKYITNSERIIPSTLLGKLLIEVNVNGASDDVLHRSQFDLDDDDEPPPPIPPKRFGIEDTEEFQYDDVIK